MSTLELQNDESPSDGRHVANVEPTPLQKPLSELTKHLTHIPIKNMEIWVHRTTETRRFEVSEINGKVARPMNCFMLYRSAYADRTKEWFSIDNHQGVSQLTGKSWRLETMEIRQKYRRLATIEKYNHAIAHPCYKFAPKEKVQQAKQDEQLPGLSCSGASDLGPALAHEYAKCLMESGDGSTPLSLLQHGLPMMTYPNTAWPTKSPCSPSSELVQTGNRLYHFLQPNDSQRLKVCQVEDELPSSIELQESQNSSSTVLLGLPEVTNGNHDHLLSQSDTLMGGMPTESAIDSQLLEYNENSSDSIAALWVYSRPQHPVWQDIPTNNSYLPTTNTASALSMAHPVDLSYLLMEEYKTWESSLRPNMSAPSGDFSGRPIIHPQEACHGFDGFQ